MNGKEVARRLRVPYRTALDLLRSGTITSRKEKGVWVAEAATVQRFKRGNDRKIEKLRPIMCGSIGRVFLPTGCKRVCATTWRCAASSAPSAALQNRLSMPT